MRSERRAGLTLIEMVMVIFILGILFSITAISVSGITPVYRVRSASRTIGSKIEELRALAISSGKAMGLRYTLTGEEEDYYQLILPAPEDFPDQPFEDRELGIPEDLPPGVRFRQVVTASGQVVGPPDEVSVIFSPMGTSGTHVVTLEGTSKEGNPIILSLKYNAIIGALSFVDGEAMFAHFED